MRKNKFISGLSKFGFELGFGLGFLSVLFGISSAFSYPLSVQQMEELKKEVDKEIQLLQPRVQKVIQESQQPIYQQKAKEVQEQVQRIQEQAMNHMVEIYSGNKNGKNLHPHFNSGDMLYIFMSSSVPKFVWHSYIMSILDTGLNNNIVMVLRGCIGGCTYVMPTVHFLKDVLTDDGQYPKGYDVQIWIDPLLFERFDIHRVPCFVFVRGQKLKSNSLSAGIASNIINPGQAYEVCGAWSFWHNVRVLYHLSHSQSLKSILPSLSKEYSNKNK